MVFLRQVMNFVVGFALVGIIATSFMAPRYFAWDNTPTAGKALCDCADVTRQTAERLINAQLLGGSAGAVLGLLLGVAFAMSRRKKDAAAAAAPANPPAAP